MHLTIVFIRNRKDVAASNLITKYDADLSIKYEEWFELDDLITELMVEQIKWQTEYDKLELE